MTSIIFAFLKNSYIILTLIQAEKKPGVYLKPKDLRDFFSQEMCKALIPDRFINIFQERAPRNVLAKHYTPQGIRLQREIYDKADLKVLI